MSKKTNKTTTEDSHTGSRRHLQHWVIIAFYLIIYDIVAVNFSWFLGLLLRFDMRFSSIPQNYFNAFIKFAPFYTAFCVLIFYIFHLYNSLWRFASISELNRISAATVITTLFSDFRHYISVWTDADVLLHHRMYRAVLPGDSGAFQFPLCITGESAPYPE